MAENGKSISAIQALKHLSDGGNCHQKVVENFKALIKMSIKETFPNSDEECSTISKEKKLDVGVVLNTIKPPKE